MNPEIITKPRVVETCKMNLEINKLNDLNFLLTSFQYFK